MRRLGRVGGLVLATVGVLALAWVVIVWQWQDPFTALYTTWQQHKLEAQLNREFRAYEPRPQAGGVLLSRTAEAKAIHSAATRLRRPAMNSM